MKLRDAWNRSDPTKGRYNISGWWKYDHPCDRTSDYAGWRGIRCSGVLASDGNSTVCELFIVELGYDHFNPYFTSTKSFTHNPCVIYHMYYV